MSKFEQKCFQKLRMFRAWKPFWSTSLDHKNDSTRGLTYQYTVHQALQIMQIHANGLMKSWLPHSGRVSTKVMKFHNFFLFWMNPSLGKAWKSTFFSCLSYSIKKRREYFRQFYIIHYSVLLLFLINVWNCKCMDYLHLWTWLVFCCQDQYIFGGKLLFN